jgi:hypothetical protein
MTSGLLHRLARTTVLVTGLVAFLIASNNCELGAFGNRRAMACATIPGVAAKPVATHSSPCCARAAAKSAANQPRPATSGSCCRAPAAMPKAEALTTPDHARALFASPGVLLPRIADVVWVGHRAAPDGEPPPPPGHAPLSARAPPLA